MNVKTIEMDSEHAFEKMLAFESKNRADSAQFNSACMDAYSELADGNKLVHLSKSIKGGGFDLQGRPKLAIAPADRKQVYFRWEADNPICYFTSAAANSRNWNRDLHPRMIRYVRLDAIHHDLIDPSKADQPWNLKIREGYALVPEIPADARPTGQKKDWFILWEVDQWADKPLLAEPPTDPYLLRHVFGEIYAVLAEWDLTEVEKAAMEFIN